MNTSIILIFAILIALTIGFYIGKLLSKTQSNAEKSNLDGQLTSQTNQLSELKISFHDLQIEKQKIQTEKEEFAILLAKKENDFDNLLDRTKEQKEELNHLQEKFTKEFENLANKILEEKTQKFTEQNKENLKNILSPLQDKILHFEKKVEDTHKESIDYHAALRQQIVSLSEMNAQMSKETINLTKALKGDSKMQGNWGELVLERVLEKSGLEKGREYEVQQAFTSEEGSRILPDVITVSYTHLRAHET
jgi:DNA recombination protein RmuC